MTKSFLFLTLFTLMVSPLFNTKTHAQTVIMETSKGTIEIELYPKKAPKTVANFLSYVKDGFYKGTIFHRVIDGFMIQGGGFTADLKKKETKAPIKNEANNGLGNDTGTIAMARTSDPHSATAQFFINVNNNSSLNHSGQTPRGWGYAVFGKVKKGMSVVNQIKKVATGANGPFRDLPTNNIIIKNVRVK